VQSFPCRRFLIGAEVRRFHLQLLAAERSRQQASATVLRGPPVRHFQRS
jgi:hypothetical protein